MASFYVTSTITATVSGVPDVGVIIAIVLEVPGVKLATSTTNVTIMDSWGAMLPLPGTIFSQDGEDTAIVHNSTSLPLFVILTVCGGGLFPAVVECQSVCAQHQLRWRTCDGFDNDR